MTTHEFLRRLREFAAADEFRQVPPDVLWAKFRDDGDETALAVFLERVGGRVLRRCRAVVGDEHRAEEAFQAAFFDLFRRRKRVPTFAAACGYVYQAATNHARMLSRADRRRRAREAKAAAAVATPPGSPTDAVGETERTLAGLPDRYRRPLELKFWHGLTHAEIAAALGWRKGTVDSNVARGLTALRKQLGAAAVVAVPAALAAPAPAVTPTALARLAAPLPATVGWGVGRVAAAGLVVAGSAGAGYGVWWGRSAPPPAPPARPPAVAPAATAVAPPIPGPEVESLAAKHRRLFDSTVRPRLQAALDGLRIGDGGTAVVTSVETVSTRVLVMAEIRHGTGFTSRLWVGFDGHGRHCVVLADPFGNGVFSPIHNGDRAVLGTPGSGKEFRMPGLTAVVAAFDALPADPRTRGEGPAYQARLEPILATLAGTWVRTHGPPGRWRVTMRYGKEADGMPLWFRWGPTDDDGSCVPWTCIWTLPDGRVALQKVDPRGPVVRSADGSKLIGPGGDVWEKEK